MSGSNGGAKIKSYVERVERLEEERKGIGADIRDIYSEAKGNGFDVKTLRWLVQERKVAVADRDERDALRDTYMNALDSAVTLVRDGGLSLREAAKTTGVSKSSIHRALAVPVASQPAGVPDPANHPLRRDEPESKAGAAGGADAPTPNLYQRITGSFRPNVCAEEPIYSSAIRPGSGDDDDGMTIPDFLRGTRVTG